MRSWPVALPLLAVSIAVVAAVGLSEIRSRVPEAPPRSGRPVVVFVVLDAVRADHMAACGYPRPTTTTIRFLQEKGAALSCRAYVPGSWTLPSHASFFTGREVPDHGADCAPSIDVQGAISLAGDSVRPLGPDLPVLAEIMKNRGYLPVLVSGNPIVSRWAATGLARGFEVVRETADFGLMYGVRFMEALKSALEEARPAGKPLFLFMNICDAHNPWFPIPPGLDWVPERPGLRYDARKPENPWRRFVTGKMAPVEALDLLAQATDLYDHAVFRADRTLGWALAFLKSNRWLDDGIRLVVTSDHGEFLGEHDLLSHGTFVWEPDVRVPLLYWDGDATDPIPEPISALAAYDLVLEGRLPDPPRPLVSAGYPSATLGVAFEGKMSSITAAVWSGAEKLMWIDGKTARYDVVADPAERSPGSADGHPLEPALDALVDRVKTAANRKSAAPSQEMLDALKALGYAE